MGNPDVTSLSRITIAATGDTLGWLMDRKNRRAIPHRLERCGYLPVRNNDSKDGLWVHNKSRQVLYAKMSLSVIDRYKAVGSYMENR